MLTRTLAAAALVVGSALATATVASAEPADDPYGFHEIRDRTDYFVTPLDPGALFGDKSTRPIILSPYGTTRKIECRGDGHYVQIYECAQYDANNARHSLQRIPNPFREVYVYF